MKAGGQGGREGKRWSEIEKKKQKRGFKKWGPLVACSGSAGGKVVAMGDGSRRHGDASSHHSDLEYRNRKKKWQELKYWG